VRLGLKGKSLAAMELHDQLGGRTLLTFVDLKANAPVRRSTFVFSRPRAPT
jgi:outer membrane lipoprotein-sorting protein